MKKLFICIAVVLISLLPLSCSNTNQANSVPADVADNFIKNLYSVDNNEISTFNKSVNIRNADPNNIDKAISQANDSLVSLHNKFKTDTTEDTYKSMMKDRTYGNILENAAQKNCTFECKEVSLSQSSKSDNTIQYSYTAKIKVTHLDNQKQDEITQNGTIQIIKQNQWKVNYVMFRFVF